MRSFSQLETGVGNGGVILPNIRIGGGRSGELGMKGTEDGGDSGEANILWEGGDDLPMEESGVSAFQLTLSVRGARTPKP